MDENISYNDFTEAFDEPADNQIEGAEDTAVEDETTPEKETDEVFAAEEDAPATDAEESSEGNEQPADEKSAGKTDGDTFTLKVNKEEKTYSREEVISLAQKGADYDRVKEQLSQTRQTAEQLQGQLDQQQEAMDVLDELAKASQTDISGLLRNLRIGILKNQGLSEDAANERLLRMAAEKENAALKAAASEEQSKETGAQRAQRELAEFREAYPAVELSDELLDKLMTDVQGGMPLVKAYQKYDSAQKDAKIAELQRQLAAEKQNKENLAASPGSQKDSGGKRTKSDYDDFLEAFE